jgi:hypothetical protein
MGSIWLLLLVREASKASQQLKPDQHVVSRILLDQFTEPVGVTGSNKSC